MSQPLTPKQLKEYAEKWLKGTITPEEKELFGQWYNDHPPAAVSWPGDENEEQVRERIFSAVDQVVEEESGKASSKNKMRRGWRIAASVAAFFILGIAILKWSGKSEPKTLMQHKPVPAGPIMDKTTDYTRHIILPDGSTVILRANSKLDYAGTFSGKSREVILVGEAYFDIKHDEKRPFIIHTADIKTTVLGTAFNINAYPDAKKVTISVTRGKVRVEKNKKVLAVLTPDQQVTCNTKDEAPAQQPVNATAIVTQWTKEDMAFDGDSFEKIAELIARRYDVTIRFNNPLLQNCTIKAFFNGTESLEKVLEVLCIISNANYTIGAGKTVVLDGQGCEL